MEPVVRIGLRKEQLRRRLRCDRLDRHPVDVLEQDDVADVERLRIAARAADEPRRVGRQRQRRAIGRDDGLIRGGLRRAGTVTHQVRLEFVDRQNREHVGRVAGVDGRTERVSRRDGRQHDRAVVGIRHEGKIKRRPRRSGPLNRQRTGAARRRNAAVRDDAARHHDVARDLVRAGAQVLVRVAELLRGVVDVQRVGERRHRRARHEQHHGAGHQHLGNREPVFTGQHGHFPLGERRDVRDQHV